VLNIDIRLREQDDTGSDDDLVAAPYAFAFASSRIGRDDPNSEWFYVQAADASHDQWVQLRFAVRRLK
jgi:hypothetical protein